MMKLKNVLKKIKIELFCLVMLIMFFALEGSTYYIDFTSGKDADDGSKDHPLKYAPGMKAYTGAISDLKAGDKCVFKGGVTWTSSSFPLTVKNSGTAGSKITLSADSAWFIGKTFSPPVFNAEFSVNSVMVLGGSFIDVSNITLVNLRCEAFGDFFIGGTGNNNTVRNCVLRNWRQKGTVIDHKWGGINIDGDGWIVEGTTISGDTAGVYKPGDNGIAIRVIGNNATVRECKLSRAVTALVGGGISGFTLNDNEIYDLNGSADPATHENVMVCTNCSNSSLYNNFIHGISADVPMGFYFGTTAGGASSNINYMNNIFIDCKFLQCLAIESTNGVKIYNNIVLNNGQIGIMVHGNAEGSSKNIEIYNNIVHTTVSSAMNLVGENMSVDYNNYYTTGGSIWDKKTLTQIKTEGVYDGHSMNIDPTPYFKVNGSIVDMLQSPFIDKGKALGELFKNDFNGTLRPMGDSWDIGAIEFYSLPKPKNILYKDKW